MVLKPRRLPSHRGRDPGARHCERTSGHFLSPRTAVYTGHPYPRNTPVLCPSLSDSASAYAAAWTTWNHRSLRAMCLRHYRCSSCTLFVETSLA